MSVSLNLMTATGQKCTKPLNIPFRQPAIQLGNKTKGPAASEQHPKLCIFSPVQSIKSTIPTPNECKLEALDIINRHKIV